jgi:hypothetical protein
MGRSVQVRIAAEDVFGLLRVVDPDAGRVGRSRFRPKGSRAARVQCRCGTVKLVAIFSLRSGGTVSCGCLRRSGQSFRRSFRAARP